jgi:hypothetical protein
MNGIVILGCGPQEMDFLSKCLKICGKSAVIDPDVARMANADFAVGPADALQDLREKLESVK